MNDSTEMHSWVGRESVIEDLIDARTANLMSATLNRTARFTNGDLLPAAWHWLFFHPQVPTRDLGSEGHEALGGAMPPVTLGDDAAPRRMWAGGTLRFAEPLNIGDHAQKRSRIRAITPKSGRSGPLVFVELEEEIAVDGRTRLHEARTIVYRRPSSNTVQSGGTPAAPADADFSRRLQPDPMLLFRYSALTFNAHRIHYDVDYCRRHEGYPNLVVHGPLTATLLLDLFATRLPGRPVRQFTYRGVSPLFNPHPILLAGREDGSLWAADHAGRLAMKAEVSS